MEISTIKGGIANRGNNMKTQFLTGIIVFRKKKINLTKIYLFINYNTIINYILIINELSNFNHMLGVASQNRVSGPSR